MIRNKVLKIACLALLSVLCVTSRGMAPNINKVNLLVVPARYSVLQVAFDIVDRYPTVLVSYQGGKNGSDPLLYAWNGAEWVYVTLQDYAQAQFMQVMPSKVILVGGEDLMPESLAAASSWGSMVMNVPAVDTATLINSLANIYGFRRREWQWFSTRYNLDLIDLNEELRNDSWYDHPYVDPSQQHNNQYDDRIPYQRESYLLEESDNTYTLEEDVFIEEKVAEPAPESLSQPAMEIEQYEVEEDYGKGDISPPPFMTRIEGWDDDAQDTNELIEDPYPIK